MKKILPFCQLHSVNSTFLYVENVVVKGFYAVKPYGKVELLKDEDCRRAIIIEAKRSGRESDLESDCDEALDQIIRRKYAQGLYGYGQILCYGIAFYQKQAMTKCRKVIDKPVEK